MELPAGLTESPQLLLDGTRNASMPLFSGVIEALHVDWSRAHLSPTLLYKMSQVSEFSPYEEFRIFSTSSTMNGIGAAFHVYRLEPRLRLTCENIRAVDDQAPDQVPDGLVRYIASDYKKPYVHIDSLDFAKSLMPLIVRYLSNCVARQSDRGAKSSYAELQIRAHLWRTDGEGWINWYRDPATQYEIDIANCDERIAIEYQGYLHQYTLSSDKKKKKKLLEAGWLLIWAWEAAMKKSSWGGRSIRVHFDKINEALSVVRGGQQFCEITD